jgi:hypothetical protein
MIIGLSGYAQSGKDEIAKVLSEHGFERAAFADTLREALIALNPMAGYGLFLTDVVSMFGWEEAKRNYPEVRRLLQRMGTEAGRNIFGEQIWVNKTLGKLDSQKHYIITDVRFQNEADAIRDLGGQMWRVVRPGHGPVNGHSSEVDLDNYVFDYVVENKGDLEELKTLVLALVKVSV